MNEKSPPKIFWAGRFLYNPKTNSVLLNKRDAATKYAPNKWAFFGGKIEGNETPKECFIREFKEEINFVVKQDEISYLCDYLNKEYNTWRYVFYVESEINTSQLILGEGGDLRWIPLQDLGKYDLTDKTKRDLAFFMKTISK